MPKRKSSRAAVRNTPQPKAHNFIPAVFVDDYGRDRALTIASAKAFSKKKLDAASRAIERKSDRDIDRAIEAGDRETARAIRRLRKQERETDRSIASFFRRRIRTKVRSTSQIKHKPPKSKRSIWPSRSHALPKYDGPIRDKFNRRGVFFRSRYYSSRTAKPGVSKRVTTYIYRGSALDENGSPMFRTNVGLTIDEAVCGLDHLEQVNRSAQKNAKVLNHAVLAMDHRWTPEQMLEVGERWSEERFGQYGLPYVVSLHEPPPDGDERNWHLHVIWSWRPLERVGDHEWLVGENLRTELDGAQGMWMLRERLAALMTEMSFEAGDADVYTPLSYAARGLPVIPQIHLDEGRTRRAREGEVVEANEENHDRVVRSIAAMTDEELRAEDARLARLQEIAKSVAARFARTFTPPTIPSIGLRTATLTVAMGAIDTRGLNLAKSVPGALVVNAAPERTTTTLRLSQASVEGLAESGTRKFANLRIPKPTAVPLPRITPITVDCGVLSSMSFARTFPMPRAGVAPVAPIPVKFTSATLTLPPRVRGLPLANSSAIRTLPSEMHTAFTRLPVKGAARRVWRFAKASAAPVLPVTARFAPATFIVPRGQSAVPLARTIPSALSPPSRDPGQFTSVLRLSIPAKATGQFIAKAIPTAPLPPVHKRFAPESVANLPSVQRASWPFIAASTFDNIRMAISRASNAATAEDRQEKDARNGAEQKQQVDARARELLFDSLATKRRLIVQGKNDRWTVPGDLVERAGLSADRVEKPAFQQHLQQEAARQRHELGSIATFLAPAPGERLIRANAGWRLDDDAPDVLREVVFGWRDDPAVQEAFKQFAKLPPITQGDEQAATARRDLFLQLVHRRRESEEAREHHMDRKKGAWGRYPHPGHGGIGD